MQEQDMVCTIRTTSGRFRCRLLSSTVNATGSDAENSAFSIINESITIPGWAWSGPVEMTSNSITVRRWNMARGG
ncbi:MAG TPA: hypothetical protein PLX13_13655 [Saprospiraceae bacterium]|nr:hypothetical protein [Saprospiraceae bacterium]